MLNCTMLNNFTKALMLRMEKSMSKIISKSQNAFIKGRNIMDGVMSLHEILHDTKVRKKEGLVLKLEFEKAYDKINWKFLMNCLNETERFWHKVVRLDLASYD